MVDQYYKAFDKKQYILGVFIDFSKAFDIVDHSVLLLMKLELYSITDRNDASIKSYRSNRLQYIQVDESCRTEYCLAKCGNQWFTSNKLSINAKETKDSFLHKPSKKDDIPLMLLKLTSSNHVTEKQEFIKFLGVLVDENLNWKEHIKYTENNIAKHLRLVYKARRFLDRNASLSP